MPTADPDDPRSLSEEEAAWLWGQARDEWVQDMVTAMDANEGDLYGMVIRPVLSRMQQEVQDAQRRLDTAIGFLCGISAAPPSRVSRDLGIHYNTIRKRLDDPEALAEAVTYREAELNSLRARIKQQQDTKEDR